MKALDFFIRLIIIPGVFLFAFSLIPEAIKDVKEWSKLFFTNDSKVKRKKKRTVQVYTGATVTSNSFSHIPRYSDN